ncbi:hypothetical protein GCM10009776_37940 [Microbacterium deminutum]|uniref:Histidine kinase n=1 Tax=Microbacterium deminutum TaxID=344164 RepID=A0ABP5CZ84_9MICO
MLNIAALLAVVALVGYANESGSDVANQFTLGFLLIGCGMLGYLWGRQWWIPGLVVGVTVAVQHVVVVAFGIPEPGIQLPPGWLGSASLLILLIPALIAAGVGGWIRRGTTPRRGPTHDAPR